MDGRLQGCECCWDASTGSINTGGTNKNKYKAPHRYDATVSELEKYNGCEETVARFLPRGFLSSSWACLVLFVGNG